MNNKKDIISIETSSNVCGISFISNGECIKTIEEDSARKHVEKIPLFFQEIQKEIGFKLSEISAIAVSNGPGSFTGLRIGLSFAKGLAFSHSLPIVPIPTMMSLAFSCKELNPDIGLIHSHGEKIFCQKIYWKSNLPKSSKEIMVLSWNEFLNKYNTSKVAFHANCNNLIKDEDFIDAKLSSSSVGMLAYFMFENFVEYEPQNLVSNYVSPFNINK